MPLLLRLLRRRRRRQRWATAEAARPLIGAETRIVPLLNGVPWWFVPQTLVSVDPDGRIAAA